MPFAAKMFMRPMLTAFAFAAALPAASVLAAADDEAAFVARYHADATGILAAIHADTAHPDQKQRFVTFSIHQDPTKYVKCGWIAKDTVIECDAASGYFSAPQGQPRLYKIEHVGRVALKGLGYDLDDSEGDFQLFNPLNSPADIPATADTALKTLYEVYGVRPPAQTIDAEAPLAAPQARPLADGK